MLSIFRSRLINKISKQCISLNKRYYSDTKDSKFLVDLLVQSSKIEFSKSIDRQASPKQKINVFSKVDLPRIVNSNVPFPRLTNSSNYNKNDLVDLGKLYINYFIVKYLSNSRPNLSFIDGLEFSNRFIGHVSNIYNLEIANNINGDGPGDASVVPTDCDTVNINDANINPFLYYVGQFVLFDLNNFNSFLSKFLCEDNKSKNFLIKFSDYFRLISPNYDPEIIDYSLVWNNQLKNSMLELPKLNKPESFFNPCYLIDSKNSKLMVKFINDNSFNDVNQLTNKLNDLRDFGKLSFEFHSVLNLMKFYKQSNNEFLLILNNFNSIISDILRFSSINQLITDNKYFNKLSSGSLKSIFHQYVGIADLEQDSVGPWFKEIINYLIQNKTNPKLADSLNLTNISSLNLKRQKNFPVVPLLELPASLRDKLFLNDEPNFSLLHEIDALGKDHLLLIIYKYLINSSLNDSNNFNSYIDQYYEIVTEHINQSIKIKNLVPLGFENLNFSSSTFLGLYSLVNRNECESFILNFLGDKESMDYSKSIEYMKWLMFEYNIPNLKFNGKLIPKSTSKLNLPVLRDQSKITRFMLINNSIIVPKYKSTYWLNNNKIKNCLFQWNQFGNLHYKFSVKHSLILNMSPISIDYFNLVNKLLNSNQFFNFLLDNSQVFNLLINERYQKVLISKRFNNSLINCQFSQYISILIINSQLNNWINHLTLLFINLIENLNHNQILSLFDTFNKQFIESEFSLSALFKQRIINNIKENRIELNLPTLSGMNYQPDEFLIGIGIQYLRFMINRSNLTYGLDNFIKSKFEMLDILDESFKIDNLKQILPKKLSIYEFLSYYLLENDHIACESLVINIIESIFNKKYKPFNSDYIDRINVEISSNASSNSKDFFIWNCSEFSLPKLKKYDELHKLLLVNYFISRSYLNMIRSNKISNINQLPDLCTKFNSIGNEYYKFMVLKNLYQLNLNREISLKLSSLLLDKKFKSAIIHKSSLLNPFESKDYNHLSSKFNRNSYYFLKFNNQSFNQYIGSLTYYDITLVDNWMHQLFLKISHHLKQKSIEQKWEFLNRFEDEIESYFNKISY